MTMTYWTRSSIDCKLDESIIAEDKIMSLESPESNNSSTMTHQCPTCLIIIPCGHNTKRHIRTITGGKRHVCLICSKSYAYGNTLSANSQANKIEKPAPNKCNRKREIKIHDWKLGPNVQVSVILKRIDLTNMNFHINARTCKKSHLCSMCSKSFSNRQALVEHLMTHTRDKLFKCLHCKYTSTFKNNLEKHLRVHKGRITRKSLTKNVRNHVKVNSVKKVNNTSASKINLQSHLKCHTREKPYKCVVCNYETSSREHLNRHRRVHSGEKPYKCPLCPKWFSNISNSNRHKKTHTGVKPFKCLRCDYACVSRETLNGHVRLHTGEEPYKCPLCPKTFSNSSNSKRHIRNLHTEGKAVPPVLPKA